MLTAVEGVYENGQIILETQPNVPTKTKVMVIFEAFTANDIVEPKSPSKTLRGAWKNASEQEKTEITTYFDNVRNEWERDIDNDSDFGKVPHLRYVNPRKYS